MHNRRKFLVQSTLATTAMLVARPFKTFANIGSSCGGHSANNVTLLHTNDLFNKLSPVTGIDPYAGLGGFRQTTELIGKLRNQSPNMLLVDAGNTFSGNERQQDEHLETLQLMQSAGYDAMLPGHHDLSAGAGFLQQQFTTHTIPVIASNYRFADDDLQSRTSSYSIVWKGNIKTAIIGAGQPGHTANDCGSCSDPIKEMNELALMLKNEKHCDLVICLSQLGYKNKKEVDDITLAQQSTAIDIIIGGHSRTFMQHPTIVLNKNKREVIINHAGHSGIVLGRIDIGFDEQRRKNKVVFQNMMVGTPDLKWKKISA
jgi:5'-nucleotidase